MKKTASIYLNVLLILTTMVVFLTLAFTLVTGYSPYEALGIDPGLGALATLGGIALLFCVPHFLNRDFTDRKPGASIRTRRPRASKRPRIV